MKALRQPQKTMLRTSTLYVYEEMGAHEKMHAMIQGQIRSMREQYERDSGSNILPGQILFTWLIDTLVGQ